VIRRWYGRQPKWVRLKSTRPTSGGREAQKRYGYESSNLYMSTIEEDVDRDCDYTCAFRIDGNEVGFAAIDRCLGTPGEKSTLRRRVRGRLTAETFLRWERVAITDSGDEEWGSLTDALEHVADLLLPARKVIAFEGARANAYWWCGCFRNRPESSIRFTAHCLEKLSGFATKVYLDNYLPVADVDEIQEPMDLVGPIGVKDVAHEYRFAVAIEPVEYRIDPAGRDVSAGSWSAFDDCLTACIQWVLDNAAGSPSEIICTHTQSTFDGGPCIDAGHLSALAEAGLALTIVWRTAAS